MSNILATARAEAGLTLVELAARAGTSHATLSAYEHGRKQPRLDTCERVLAETGHELALVPTRAYTWHHVGRMRPFAVPSSLPRLDIADAFATVTLPLSVEWSEPRRPYKLRDRAERGLAYQVVLRQGAPEDIDRYVDGALLIDLWPDLHLPRPLRDAWEPVIGAALQRHRGYHNLKAGN